MKGAAKMVKNVTISMTHGSLKNSLQNKLKAANASILSVESEENYLPAPTEKKNKYHSSLVSEGDTSETTRLLSLLENGTTLFVYPALGILIRVYKNEVYLFKRHYHSSKGFFGVTKLSDFKSFYQSWRSPHLLDRIIALLSAGIFINGPVEVPQGVAMILLGWDGSPPEKNLKSVSLLKPPRVTKPEVVHIQSGSAFHASYLKVLYDHGKRIFNNLDEVYLRFWNRRVYIYIPEDSQNGQFAVVDEKSFWNEYKEKGTWLMLARVRQILYNSSTSFFLFPVRASKEDAFRLMNWNGQWPTTIQKRSNK